MKKQKKEEKKTKKTKKTNLKLCFPRYIFPNVWPVDARLEYFGPEIRILREKSSLQPAGKLLNSASRPKSGQKDFLICLCYQSHHGVM